MIDHDGGMTVTTDRVIYTPPWGLFGGKEGRPSITKIFRADGSEEAWRKVSNLPLKSDDIISLQTGGGGGYGSPLERDPQLVLQDVSNGYISLCSAEDDYGVVINAQKFEVDNHATQKLREQKKSAQEG